MGTEDEWQWLAIFTLFLLAIVTNIRVSDWRARNRPVKVREPHKP